MKNETLNSLMESKGFPVSSKVINACLKSYVEYLVTTLLEEGRVRIANFGTFEITTRKVRSKFTDNQSIVVERVTFRPSKHLKNLLAKGGK